jgi:argininosuccinate synthase
MTSIIVTKIEAARRQLNTAIELWFNDGDPVSIHTLASSAHQIIHDLNRRNKGPDLFLDTIFIKEEPA